MAEPEYRPTIEDLMGRSKLVALAVALAMLPGLANAQSAPASVPAASTAEAASGVKPTDASVPTTSDGGGTQSATLAAGADAPDQFNLKPTLDIGQPNGDWRLQTAVTDLGKQAHWFNEMLLWLMGAVTLLVFGLLAYAMVRFRAARNPVASRTSHNTLIEVIWTAVPVLLLVIIAVPSFRLLADQYDPPRPDLTIKATGHQWYWEYSYPDLGDVGFDSLILTDAEAAKRGDPRLLGVDNRLVVPAGAVVKVLTTSTDVIHSFAMPAFWVKMDSVPGRINETWFKVDRPGVYYGQCSELCGTKHGFMPIVIEVVTPAQFRTWATAKLAENKVAPTPAIEAALTDAVNGKPSIQMAAVTAPVAANDNAAPAAAAVPAAGAEASQNSNSTAPAAAK